MRIADLGDGCVVLELEARVDPAINATCSAVARRLNEDPIPGVRDVVATFHTVAVHFDPLRADRDAVAGRLGLAAASAAGDPAPDARVHRIPVCYGGEHGPDLESVARFAACSEEEVVRLHTGSTYRVYMMGFLPGFAYLASVSDVIAMPRHDVPRLRVPAGSVGVAGVQTGVYPREAPGGWRILGRTWIDPFDLRRSPPWRFAVGDVVRFEPVDQAAYRAGVAAAAHGTA